MTSPWRRFRAAYAMELRLLCLHWSYPLLHALWFGFLLSLRLKLGMGLGSARSALETDLGSLTIGLLSLVSLFVAGAAAARSRRTRFAALEEALPTGAELLLGRWLAALTGLGGALLTPVLFAAWQGPAASLLAALPGYLADAAVTLAFTSAAAWWLVDWLEGRRWVYPLLAAGWLGFLVAQPILGATTLHLNGLALLDFARLAFSRQGHYQYAAVWSGVQQGRLPLWFDLFYLGLAVGCLGLLLWRQQAVRLHRRPWSTGLLLAGGLALALAGGSAFVATTAAWNARGAAIRAATDQALLTARDPADAATAVDAYDLTADLTDPARLQAEATLTVRNAGQAPTAALTLTLSPDLAVSDASAGVGVEQSGSLLRLTLPQPLAPGQSTQVRLRYAGRIWSVVDGVMPRPAYFTAADGVRLSVLAGWYPLAGRQGLSPWAHFAEHAPAAFHLRVSGPGGWQFGSNLPAVTPGEFRAASASWVFLAGAPQLAVERTGPVTVVGARDDLPALRTYAGEYAAAMGRIGRFFPDVQPQGLTLLALPAVDGLIDSPPPAGGQLAVAVNRSDLDRVGRFYTRDYLLQPVIDEYWQMGQGKPDLAVQREVAAFINLVDGVGGDARRLVVPPGQQGVEAALAELYVHQGETAVQRALTQLRQQADKVSAMQPAAARAWVLAAGQP